MLYFFPHNKNKPISENFNGEKIHVGFFSLCDFSKHTDARIFIYFDVCIYRIGVVEKKTTSNSIRDQYA